MDLNPINKRTSSHRTIFFFCRRAGRFSFAISSGFDPTLLTYHRWRWNAGLLELEQVYCLPE